MATPLTKNELRGVIPPMATAFDARQDVDLALFEREVAYMQEAGVQIAVVGGSTGEGAMLNPEELASLTEVAADGGLHAIGGIVTTNTRDAVQRARLAGAAGASALLVAPPIYVEPTETALEHYLVDIAEAAQLPIVFYNHYFYTTPVLRRLAALPEVIGIKESTVSVIAELAELAGDDIAVSAGIDPTPLAGLIVGATSVIAGVNAVIPREATEVFKAFEDGDLERARELLARIAPLARLMTQPLDFPACVKFAINAMGREVGDPRLPCQPVSATAGEPIREALKTARVLQPESVG
jgi:4-hydroxy-tetrahydrodipicolinate synthase